MASLARNTLFLTVAKTFSVGIYAALGFLLPVFVRVEENGLYGYLMSLMFFGGMLASFGVPLVLTREVARHPDRAAAVHAAGRSAVFLGVGLSVLVLGAWLVGEGLYTDDLTPRLLVLFAIGMAIVLAEGLGSVADAVFQGFERMALPALIEIQTGAFRAGGAMLALVVLPERWRLEGIFVCFLIGSTLRAWLLPRLLRRRLLLGALPPRSHLSARLAQGLAMIRQSGAIAVFRVLRMLRNRLDVVILGVLVLAYAPAADPNQARGLYVQAVRVALLFHTMTMAFNTAVFPRFARLTQGAEQGGDLGGARIQYERAVRWQAWWALPLAVALWAWAAPVAGWFGPAYRFGIPEAGLTHGTADVLRVLLPAVALDAVGGPVGMLMLGVRDLERRIPWIGAALLTTSLVLNLVLVPRFGLLGAAWAALGASSVEFLLKVGIVARLLGNPLPIFLRTLPHLGLAAAAVAAAFALGLAERPILGLPLAASLYVAATLLLGLADPALLERLPGRRRGSS